MTPAPGGGAWPEAGPSRQHSLAQWGQRWEPGPQAASPLGAQRAGRGVRSVKLWDVTGAPGLSLTPCSERPGVTGWSREVTARGSWSPPGPGSAAPRKQKRIGSWAESGVIQQLVDFRPPVRQVAKCGRRSARTLEGGPGAPSDLGLALFRLGLAGCPEGPRLAFCFMAF